MNGFSGRYSGRVEVFFGGQWGTICERGWDDRDANVVCNQLGYGRATAVTGGTFGVGKGPILLSNLDCQGNETSIVDCVRGGIGIYDKLCDHTKDAGVQCSGRKFKSITFRSSKRTNTPKLTTNLLNTF